jgi:hypothetical protein
VQNAFLDSAQADANPPRAKSKAKAAAKRQPTAKAKANATAVPKAKANATAVPKAKAKATAVPKAKAKATAVPPAIAAAAVPAAQPQPAAASASAAVSMLSGPTYLSSSQQNAVPVFRCGFCVVETELSKLKVSSKGSGRSALTRSFGAMMSSNQISTPVVFLLLTASAA